MLFSQLIAAITLNLALGRPLLSSKRQESHIVRLSRHDHTISVWYLLAPHLALQLSLWVCPQKLTQPNTPDCD